tara:strand:+ start:23 stop:580 length:558 start_codon:yes stop_codon:yes gene_type:complete
MPKTREERVAVHKKQERLQVSDGVPAVDDLKGGVPVLRLTDEGVVQYVKHNGVLYRKVFDRVGDSVYNVDSEISSLQTGESDVSALNDPPTTDGDKGYVILSGGFILNFGFETITANSLSTVVYTKAFPNQVFSLMCSVHSDPGTHNDNIGIREGDTSGSNADTKVTIYNSAGGTYGIFWWALGN